MSNYKCMPISINASDTTEYLGINKTAINKKTKF